MFLSCVCIVIALNGFLASSAFAENSKTAGILGSIFSGENRYTINVVDEHSQAIPSATIWVVMSTPSSGYMPPEFMQRLAGRYGDRSNADYVHGNNLHPKLLRYFSRTDGLFTVEYKPNDYGRGKSLPISIAVIKRGYHPAIYSEDSKAGSHSEITVQLRKNPDEQVDARMLQFDLLRSQVLRGDEPGPRNEDKAALLAKIDQSIRDLAAEFEREGKLDQASVLYHYLAYMPSIDYTKDATGKIVGRGYTNSFDERSSRRVADLRKSVELNQTNPQIRFQRIANEYKSKGAVEYWKKDTQPVRDEYIKVLEGYLSKHSEQMWPGVYRELITLYRGSNNIDKACESLNRFYRFEPHHHNEKGWKSEAAMLQSKVKMEKWREMKKVNPLVEFKEVSVEYECVIQGLVGNQNPLDKSAP